MCILAVTSKLIVKYIKRNIKNKQINKHLMICVFTSEHLYTYACGREHAPSNALTHTFAQRVRERETTEIIK